MELYPDMSCQDLNLVCSSWFGVGGTSLVLCWSMGALGTLDGKMQIWTWFAPSLWFQLFPDPATLFSLMEDLASSLLTVVTLYRNRNVSKERESGLRCLEAEPLMSRHLSYALPLTSATKSSLFVSSSGYLSLSTWFSFMELIQPIVEEVPLRLDGSFRTETKDQHKKPWMGVFDLLKWPVLMTFFLLRLFAHCG